MRGISVETEGVAGESGGIPGSLRATPHSAVIVAWLELAGISGSLDDSEVQMLGETIAHEAGHYLGLVHPVQFDEDLDIVAWDASTTPVTATMSTPVWKNSVPT